MKAILTKRLAPTNTKPARIKAYDSDGNNLVLSVHDAELYRVTDVEALHRVVAYQFAIKMDWLLRPGGGEYTLHGGGTKEGYAWVLV